MADPVFIDPEGFSFEPPEETPPAPPPLPQPAAPPAAGEPPGERPATPPRQPARPQRPAGPPDIKKPGSDAPLDNLVIGVGMGTFAAGLAAWDWLLKYPEPVSEFAEVVVIMLNLIVAYAVVLAFDFTPILKGGVRGGLRLLTSAKPEEIRTALGASRWPLMIAAGVLALLFTAMLCSLAGRKVGWEQRMKVEKLQP